jgi:hypothetical protein
VGVSSAKGSRGQPQAEIDEGTVATWRQKWRAVGHGVLIRYDDHAEMAIDYSLYLVTGRDLIPDGTVRCFG